MVDAIKQSLSYFQPELALTITFLAAIILTLFFRKKPELVAYIGLVGFAVAGVLLYMQNGVTKPIFSNMYVVDPFSVFFKSVILFCSAIIIVFSLLSSEMKTVSRRLGEYYSIIVGMTFGMMLMTGATNLLMMYLALGTVSISSYILSGFTKEVDRSSEASLKYVIYGALSSGLMLYGISILYGLTGSTDIYAINKALSEGTVNSITMLIAGLLILAGFGYKISCVPFHFWTPDVYEGAPITITAFLSVASKAAGFAMMIRFFKVTFFDSSVVLSEGLWATLQGFDWNIILAAISVMTMTLGNIVAIWQNNLKRLLAYSSIAHAGYILMGIVVLSNEGIAAMLIYFVVYLFMILGAFYVVMIVANKTGSEDINEYKGLGYRAPFVAVSMAIFLIALTGIPPTGGFVGKLYLFAALINAKWIWLAVVGVLNSVVSLYYYVRIFRNMFLRDPEGKTEHISFTPVSIVVLILLVIPNILLGLYFTPLVNWAQNSVNIFMK
jgi:NADH-quinone oxidoreductase subunit N